MSAWLQVNGETVKLGIPGSAQRMEASAKLMIPLQRVGTPEDAAGAMLMLASPYASYITAQVQLVGCAMDHCMDTSSEYLTHGSSLVTIIVTKMLSQASLPISGQTCLAHTFLLLIGMSDSFSLASSSVHHVAQVLVVSATSTTVRVYGLIYHTCSCFGRSQAADACAFWHFLHCHAIILCMNSG